MNIYYDDQHHSKQILIKSPQDWQLSMLENLWVGKLFSGEEQNHYNDTILHLYNHVA